MKLAVTTDRGRAIIGELDDGDKGIDATIGAMQAVIRAAQGEPVIHEYAQAIAAHARGTRAEYPLELERFLRGAVLYRDDPADTEELQDPAYLLGLHRARGGSKPVEGDCDDRAMMGAALLMAHGFAPVLIVVGASPALRGGRFKHVFYGYTTAAAGEPATVRNVVPFDPQERMQPGIWERITPRLRIYRA